MMTECSLQNYNYSQGQFLSSIIQLSFWEISSWSLSQMFAPQSRLSVAYLSRCILSQDRLSTKGLALS